MNRFKIDTRSIMSGAWEVLDVVVTFIRVILLIGGAAASSLADVTLGSVTLSLLFVNTANLENIRGLNLAPFVVSLGASGIQLILWQMLENKGWQNALRSKSFMLGFLMVIAMKFADDFMDISSVRYLMVNSPLIGALGQNYFWALQYTVMFLVWVLAGFSELFVVRAVEILKGSKPQRQEQQQPYKRPEPQPFKSKGGYEPTHKKPQRDLSEDTLEQLLRRTKNN